MNHNKLKQTGRRVLAGALAGVALNIFPGCGVEEVSADNRSAQPVATADATPSSVTTPEKSPRAASAAPETHETIGQTNLANSETFSRLSLEDQAHYIKLRDLSESEFKNQEWYDKSQLAYLIVEAHKKEAIEAIDDNYRNGINVGEAYYDGATNASIKITRDNPGKPRLQLTVKRYTAIKLASSGDPKLIEDAKKIAYGTAGNADYPTVVELLDDINNAAKEHSDLVRPSVGGISIKEHSNLDDENTVYTYGYGVEYNKLDEYGYAKYLMKPSDIKLPDGTAKTCWTPYGVPQK